MENFFFSVLRFSFNRFLHTFRAFFCRQCVFLIKIVSFYAHKVFQIYFYSEKFLMSLMLLMILLVGCFLYRICHIINTMYMLSSLGHNRHFFILIYKFPNCFSMAIKSFENVILHWKIGKVVDLFFSTLLFCFSWKTVCWWSRYSLPDCWIPITRSFE